MKLSLSLLAIFFGVVLTVHLAMNGKVGVAIGNPRVGNMLFWCIGAVGAIVIGLSGWQSDALNGIRHVNPLLLTAGLMGASLVFGIAWLFPKVGAANATIALLFGQIVSSMVLSHFGWLGSPVQPVTMRSALGALVMLVGSCWRRGGRPAARQLSRLRMGGSRLVLRRGVAPADRPRRPAPCRRP